MESNKISIIIPIYKAEKYLDKCVESAVKQTYQNLEIILVDDGSPDNCPAMCDVWAQRDLRIKVIHKQNGGLSSARNAGLDIFSGEYVFFLDSDDYISHDCIELLITAIMCDKSDACVGNTLMEDENGKALESPRIEKRCVLSRHEIFERCGRDDNLIYVISCNKLYKKEIFNDIRFPDGKLHEDEFTFFKVFDKCEKISFVEDTTYFYVQHTNSIMGSCSPRKLDCIEAYWQQINYFIDNGYLETAKIIRRNSSFVMSKVLKENKLFISDNLFKTAMRFYKKTCYLAASAELESKKTVMLSIFKKYLQTYPFAVMWRRFSSIVKR